MKKICFLLTNITIFLAMFVQLNAQDGRINFSVYETGKYYKVILTNGMEVNGMLRSRPRSGRLTAGIAGAM